MYKLPETLCIHLKRFRMYEFNGGMGYSGKISQYVQFPSDGLDVRPFMHKGMFWYVASKSKLNLT